MDESGEEAADRRRKRADYIDQRVRDMLYRLLMRDFRITLNDYQIEVFKRNTKLKKGQLADMERDNDLEQWLEKEANRAAESVAKHIVNFLREQITTREL